MSPSRTRIFERHDDAFGYYFDIDEELEVVRSDHQEIRVVAAGAHGRIMLIDGLTMLTENTHYIYHEIMAHLPMSCLRQPRAALVIGGGDGGVVTELVKYAELERIVLAELDAAVVDVSKRWFPEIAAGLDDPRVEIEIGDGAAYAAANPSTFDVVIIDSTDICEEAAAPAQVASPLASDVFYADLKRVLRPGGVAIQVLGSPIYYRAAMAALMRRLDGVWPLFSPVLMPCPFYITGDWAAGLYTVDGSVHPTKFHLDADALNYFNADIARGVLALPNDIKSLLDRADR